MKDFDWFGTTEKVMKIGAGIAVLGAAFSLFKK